MPENFENEKPEEFSEEKINEFLKKTIEAMDNSPLYEDFVELEKKHTTTLKRDLAGEPRQEEGEIELGTIGNVEFPDFISLQIVLERFGFPKEIIEKDIVGHEKEHFQKALEYNLIPRIFLRFLKFKDGGISFFPSLVVDIPDDWPEKSKILREIMEAASELSPSDEERLKE